MRPSPDRPVDLAAAPDPVAAFRDAEDTGRPVLLRTAGSSAAPRGVVRSTGSWTRSFAHVSALAAIDAGSRVLVPGPSTSSMNLFARVHAAYVGARIVELPTQASHAVLTPSGLDALLDGPVPEGLAAVVAGDRLSPALHRRATGRGLVVHHYYGAAELSFVAWGAHAEDLAPFPEVEVEIRDGEVWVRSPYLCEGYGAVDGVRPGAGPGPWRRSPDGFASVGDRGHLEDGRLRLGGRPGTLTTGGATVQVGDVEAVLRPLAHGDVLVVGAPTNGWARCRPRCSPTPPTSSGCCRPAATCSTRRPGRGCGSGCPGCRPPPPARPTGSGSRTWWPPAPPTYGGWPHLAPPRSDVPTSVGTP
ncbi:AMP-binding protein [Nocardioides mesophilus]|uniref:AMP-binding protein n=1 Tax=Nocardioides mesophilus TaxID=433659 RepID=A0A7G9RBA8_9ACTN|nr:AMP-binding protein [Nocardioides mesophilus]QNN52883.1 AMP-binding protein [Nocardioides mesophilus]